MVFVSQMPVFAVLLLACLSLSEASIPHTTGAQDYAFRHAGRKGVVSARVKPQGYVHPKRKHAVKAQSLAQQSAGRSGSPTPKTGAVDPMMDPKNYPAGKFPLGGSDFEMVNEMEETLKNAMQGIRTSTSTKPPNHSHQGKEDASLLKSSQSDGGDPAMPSLPGMVTDFQDGQAVLPWYKILQYSSNGYAPNINAVGNLEQAFAANSFAKLSDEQIYSLGGKKYYLRFTSSLDNVKLYVDVNGINYTDTARAMGYASKTVGMCESPAFGTCTFNNVGLQDVFKSPSTYGSSSDCSKWVTDKVGAGSCQQTAGNRCFQSGGGTSCGDQVRNAVTVWIKPQEFNSHADCEDFSGYYMDGGGFTVLIQQFGCLIMAKNYARWPNPDANTMETLLWQNNTQGTVVKERVQIFGLNGWTLDLANNPNRTQALYGMSKLILEGNNDNVPNKNWYREPCNRFHGLWTQGATEWLVNQSACNVNITKPKDASWPTSQQPFSLGTVVGNTVAFTYDGANVTGNLDASLLVLSWSNTDQWNRGEDWL